MDSYDQLDDDLLKLDMLASEVTRLESEVAAFDKHKPGKHDDLEDLSSDEPDDDGDEEEDAIPKKKIVRKNIPGSRHRFTALAENLANEEGVPMAEAMTRARKKYPDLFASYQDYNTVTKSYASLVQDEMRKNCCSYEVSAQRIALLNPQAAADSIAKREGDFAVSEFMRRCDELMQQDKKITKRSVAMEIIRARHPSAYDKLQEV